MAEGRSIGTVFVELALDADRYTKGQQRLYKDATSTSLSIEENFRKLGVKSSAEMDLMRAKITNSFNMIAHSSQATANDILRADKAKNEQLARLDEQQFGKQTTLLQSLKEHWLAFSAAAVAAWMAVGKAMEFVELGAKAQQAEESFRMVAEASKIASDALIENLKRAAAGTVDDSDIMQAAVKGLVLGLNDKQLVTIMENARLAARYAGVDVKTAFGDITNAIGTDMPRALRQYGQITREEARQVQEALAAGAKDIDLYRLAMAHAAVNSAKFGEAQKNAAEGVQVFRAAITEAREAGGKFFIKMAEGVGANTFALSSFLDRVIAVSAGIVGMQDTYASFMAKADENARKRNALLGIKTPEGEAGADEVREKARARLAEAEAALKKEQDRVKAAAGATKAAKDAAEEAKFLAKALAEGEEEEAKVFREAWQAYWESVKAMRAADAADGEQVAKLQASAQEDEFRVFVEAWQAYWDSVKAMRAADAADAERVAKLQADAEEEAAQISREAWQFYWESVKRQQAKAEEAMRPYREAFGDVFSSISQGITAAVRGVQQGTQTMEEAFRNTAVNIMLSIQDLIIRRGLGALEKALEKVVFPSKDGGWNVWDFVKGLFGGGSSGGSAGGFMPAAAGGTSLFEAMPLMESFQGGGTVRGPVGVPRLAVVHGGEEIRTPEQQKAGGDRTVVQQIFNVSPGVAETVRREVRAMMPELKAHALEGVLGALNQGGAVTRAFRHRS